jgi:RNA polymerase sigma factor (TIGR02999 family)
MLAQTISPEMARFMVFSLGIAGCNRLFLEDTVQAPNTTCLRYYRVDMELTRLLEQARNGDAQARDALFAAAYPALQKLAHARLRESGRSTMLDTRSLVHESFVRFVQSGELRAEDRHAFFGYVSQVMRSVIVNTARDRARQKRGSGLRPLTLNTQIDNVPDADPDADVLRIHDALESLEAADARLAQVVQMRYFGGYSEEEVAESLDVTVRTVQRLWLKARILLQAAMK